MVIAASVSLVTILIIIGIIAGLVFIFAHFRR